MALTAYQLQYRQRMKRGIKQRAAADRKARAYARLLAAALADVATAADVMNRLNTLYNVDVSTQTLLAHSLMERVGAAVLTTTLGESQPGEEAVLFHQVPDGNGGQALATEAVFGEPVSIAALLKAPPVPNPTPVDEAVAVAAL